MKLKDWAEKQGIAYLTAWRWFKAGDPRLVNAYQSSSGTIIVPDEADFLEQPMTNGNQAIDVMSLFLKKTVEFSKSNSSIEDFAAYILSNFSLKINHVSESPKYSKNKPKSEDIQRHFRQFIKPKGEKPKANMFVAEPEALDELVALDESKSEELKLIEIKNYKEEVLAAQLSESEASYLLDNLDAVSTLIKTSKPGPAEGLVSRTVDFNSTPQQINYIDSTDKPLGTFSLSNLNVNAGGFLPIYDSTFVTSNTSVMPAAALTATLSTSGMINAAANSLSAESYYTSKGDVLTNDEDNDCSADLWSPSKFKPTQKELISATKSFESAAPAAIRRRGRKPKVKL